MPSYLTLLSDDTATTPELYSLFDMMMPTSTLDQMFKGVKSIGYCTSSRMLTRWMTGVLMDTAGTRMAEDTEACRKHDEEDLHSATLTQCLIYHYHLVISAK